MGLKCLFGHKFHRILFGNWKQRGISWNGEPYTETVFVENFICERCFKEKMVSTDIYGIKEKYSNPEAIISMAGQGDTYRQQVNLFKQKFMRQ